VYCKLTTGFGRLASCSRVRGFIPTEAVGFFSDVKKSSACLPSEGKKNNLPHVPTLGHVKDPSSWSLNYGLLAKFVQVPSLANRGLSRRWVRGASGDDGRKLFQHVGHRGPVYKGLGAMNLCYNLPSTTGFGYVEDSGRNISKEQFQYAWRIK
jgi:hypothetical protein